MEQLKIEHKNITKKDRRPRKGRSMALSRHIYRLQNTNTFYVESETRDDQYYFCKFKLDVMEECICSCKDNSMRGQKCKHLWGIEFAIKWGTIKDIDNPLTDVKEDTAIIKETKTITKPMITSSLSYKDDEYTF
jgi:predicted nucleic acid-binding Zn finger protein